MPFLFNEVDNTAEKYKGIRSIIPQIHGIWIQNKYVWVYSPVFLDIIFMFKNQYVRAECVLIYDLSLS